MLGDLGQPIPILSIRHVNLSRQLDRARRARAGAGTKNTRDRIL
jgi:hypothetical protein